MVKILVIGVESNARDWRLSLPARVKAPPAIVREELLPKVFP